jgi:type I restriction enzyme R subunit
MVAHAAVNGAGHPYLVQHSAGSGKSNTIAWLAHRLASLHTPADPAVLVEGLTPNTKVFSKVIVITDRVILDRQLQDTIFQFDHVTGVVQCINEDSGQLAEALTTEGAQVIITTLQKFPFVLDKVETLAGSTFAVIVDEAHSSQTGENVKALKATLSKVAAAAGDDAYAEIDVEALAAAEAQDAAIEDASDPEDAVATSVAERGKQANLSFFAFTATPKHKTLELFGTPRVIEGVEEPELRPFHVYSMRQAIEEKFILDVLRNYVTYSTYYKLATTSPDDPELDVRKASQSITRFASLHPSNLAQKAEIIVEHFRRKTQPAIGGRAKAMVVTRSRLHAVKYKQAIDAHIAKKGYADFAALVAFSGAVIDDTGAAEIIWTEPGMNGIPEKELPERFAYTTADDPQAGTSDAEQDREYGVLVVAEKYQTGYDQPLLTTMFVDKKLEGVKAVQTLSRLNRTHPLKRQDDLFILDFANDAADIAEAFRPFYETTVAEPTDPVVLYTVKNRIDAQPVIVEADVDALVAALLAIPSAERIKAHEKLHKHTNAAVTRFKQLVEDDPEGAEDFRDALGQFCRLYAFLAQIMPFSDVELEKLYLYGRLLDKRLPKRNEGAVDLGEDVELTHLRIQDSDTHDVGLGGGDGDQTLPGFSPGTGRQHERKEAPLSTIIEALNDRFGTTFTNADQLHFEQSVAAAMEDPNIVEQALANDEENFAFGFDPQYEGIVLDRHELNDALVQRFLSDPSFKDYVTDWARAEAYRRIREVHRDQTG